MVRKRKSDPDKQKKDVGQGISPKQEQQRPEETSKSTARDMQYISNSRSRTRLGSPVPTTGTLRWFCRLRLVRLFVVALVVGCVGFAAGRFVHQKRHWRLSTPGNEIDKGNGRRPYLHTDFHEGILVKRFGAVKYADDDPRHLQSIKELKERHAASRNQADIAKQSNQNHPNVIVQQQHIAAKQQHVSQPEAATQHQQHAAHQQQAALTQNGANQPAGVPQQHAAQQDTAKQQHAANQQPQQHNAQHAANQQPQQHNAQQPAAQLQQPKLPQAAAKPAGGNNFEASLTNKIKTGRGNSRCAAVFFSLGKSLSFSRGRVSHKSETTSC